MNKTFKLLIALLIFISVGLLEECYAVSIPKCISDSEINSTAVSISVKDVKTGKVVFELNEKQPMIPASTLKILTSAAALDILGKDYKFTTALYKNTNNELFLKLGADPYLVSDNLKEFIAAAKAKNVISPKMIYFDDSILDSNEWGEGWQWDDDLNPLMAKFSSYNLDQNLLYVIVMPTTNGSPAIINTTKFYPTTFMNLVTTGDKNELIYSRQNHISPDMISIEGTIHTQQVGRIPINHPKRYFIIRMEEAIRGEKYDYYNSFKSAKTPVKNTYLIKEITTPISSAMNDILKKSDNYVAETLFKIAGGKYADATGTQENSLKMFQAYCDKEGLKTEDIRVVDGSGVSKNNIMTADFMTEFLITQAKKEDFNQFKDTLPTAGEGTLSNRMLYFQNNLRAKTGTLSDVSCITGYITTREGKLYAFDIMMTDPKSKPSDKKLLEEYILRAIHTSY